MRLILFCVLLGVIQAAPTTNTTNTTTDGSFQAPSFTTRSMWTIVSSSVLTLFACVYSAIHPNIPSPKGRGYPYILWRQLGTMMLALIAPELIVIWAMRQWFSAQEVTKQFEHFKKSGYPKVYSESEEKVPVKALGTGHPFLQFFFLWQKATGRLYRLFVAGFLSVLASLWHSLCAPVRWVARWIRSEQFEPDPEEFTWTQTHSFFALMGGFMLYVNGKPYCVLQPEHIRKLIRQKCIDAPTLTADEINDRSKGNAISKGLVILQVAWFVVQLITRAIYRLEITQLEVGTLAFAVLNFLTYAVWWYKPLNVECPHPVHWKLTESELKDYIDVSDTNEFAQFRFLPRVLRPIIELIGWAGIPTSRKLQVPTFDGSIKLNVSDRMVLQQAALHMATIFGGIHCMAWFFAFTTYQEQMLWRISAVAITCTPWLCLSAYLVREIINSVRHIPDSAKHVIWGVICSAFAILYITARAVLLVLMFTTLRNLPPDAYKAVSWVTLVPHL
ncbi:uncharacterized protein EDB93DRAFT_1255111 [Suillus bovinus]|uniref:uncharacterized protein n=1 Tax=Suillus bovinus TaxID=48563 RepID=UPI001B8747BB|nr:uncharacterized protein EDB93DRAFT_1255111 [Suillus bovinus]KAG2132692.1 hypothetical protein EDB93DRAFT_1255111 [Suillus bovinus]